MHRLALALGVEDVDALGRRLTVDQVRRWWAYWRLEPFGDDWRRSARLSTFVRAAMGAEPKPKDEEVFMPTYRETQTEDEVIQELAKIPQFAEQLRKQGKIK